MPRKRLTEEDVVEKCISLGHKYIKSYRNQRNIMTVEYECGSCGSKRKLTYNSLQSPRCHECKLINYSFTQKSRGKRIMQRTTRREQIKQGII